MTAIEWTQKTLNATTGCDQVSPGCGLARFDGDDPHGTCYALTMARRLKAMGQAKYQNDGDPRTSGPGFGITEHPEVLAEPFRWRTPQRVFVDSMSDLFHDGVSDEFIARMWAVTAMTPQHTYQILTKRHGRMRSLLSSGRWPELVRGGVTWVTENVSARMPADRVDAAVRWAEAPEYPDETLTPLPNVWLGVSVEDQKRAGLRIPALLDTPAAVRFLSCEPLLGPVDLRRVGYRSFAGPMDLDVLARTFSHPGAGEATPFTFGLDRLAGIDWVIAGGEAGPGARPLHPDWLRSLRDQCVVAGVPYFMKQYGSHAPYDVVGYGGIRDVLPDGSWSRHDRDRTDGGVAMVPNPNKHKYRALDGVEWSQYPLTPAGAPS